MSLDYIRRQYGVPAKKGQRVIALGHPGVITGSLDAYIRVRLDGQSKSRVYHPTWRVEYIADDQEGEAR